MKGDSGQTISAWFPEPESGAAPPLQADARADACIVGAGIAGLTTAYLLAKAGVSVVVLDDGPIGGGETCRTTAHLSNVLDDRFHALERQRGQDAARKAMESHAAAIDRIEGITIAEEIDCALVRLDGYLFLAPGQDVQLLADEHAAALRAGFPEVERLARAPLPGFDSGPCLRFANQAQFHPLRYLSGLARAVKRHGGRIHLGTHVTGFHGGSAPRVESADGYKVEAGAVVVATNSPVNDRVAIHTKQFAYRTYVIAVSVPVGSIPRALYWDMADPYHYVRLAEFRLGDGSAGAGVDGERELLIVGGEDHKTGQADGPARRHAALEAWTRERFPEAGPVEYRWSGQVLETLDGLAHIGRNPMDGDHLYVATGDSGMGMTHGTIAGMLLSDLILGRDNPWQELYEPARKTLRAAGEFLKENLNVAAHYVRDYAAPGEVDTIDQVAPGRGAVVRHGLTKLAVYRDLQGVVHACSAVCPHLKCVVHWNAVEETWDCPCHGSRFDPLGTVINGPANRDLAREGSV